MADVTDVTGVADAAGMTGVSGVPADGATALASEYFQSYSVIGLLALVGVLFVAVAFGAAFYHNSLYCFFTHLTKKQTVFFDCLLIINITLLLSINLLL